MDLKKVLEVSNEPSIKSNKDLENIRLLIRYEVAQIMFDLYRKRKVWGA